MTVEPGVSWIAIDRRRTVQATSVNILPLLTLTEMKGVP